jgi:5-amino-6-(5-phospho-D-ribitylamino)uracil phosphatase
VIRLVASDVDGTLLDHHGVLPPPRAAAVRALTAAGVPLVLATGKLWTSVRWLIDDLALAGPHVACNGSVVFDAEGRILHTTLLDGAVVDEVTAVLRARRIPHAVYLEDGTLVTDAVVAAHDVLPVLGEPLPIVGQRDGRGVLKVLAILPPDAEDGLRSLAGDVAHVQRTGPRFLEWNAAGADKATGLATVCALLGIPLSDVLAVGDAENDVPMLHAAGLGVAVSDASPTARAAADRTLTSDLADLLITLATTMTVPTAR